MKWVAQMPQSETVASSRIQTCRVLPRRCPGAIEQADRNHARQEADDTGKCDKAQVMLGAQTGQYAVHCQPQKPFLFGLKSRRDLLNPINGFPFRTRDGE